MIQLSAGAQRLLRADDVLVFDWHPLAMCCAAAGEIDLRRSPRSRLGRRFRALPSSPAGTAYAAPAAYPHLVGRDVAVDARRRLGIPTFSSDLPPDLGLRISLGRERPAAPKAPPATSTETPAAPAPRGER